MVNEKPSFHVNESQIPSTHSLCTTKLLPRFVILHRFFSLPVCFEIGRLNELKHVETDDRWHRKVTGTVTYTNFELPVAEKRRVIQRFQNGSIGIFQASIFANESDDNFVQLPFRPMSKTYVDDS